MYVDSSDTWTNGTFESFIIADINPKCGNKNIVEKTGCSLICYQLTTNTFNNESIGFVSNASLIKRDKFSRIRGRWNSRGEFLLACVGSVIGFGNFWRFPIQVYESGGGSFLIAYTILCLLMGVPLLIMEMGIGQFSSRGPSKAFKLVPIMYGLGWSMILISMFIGVYYAAIISWCFYYFFAAFKKVMPWTVCTHIFNSPNCLGTLDNKTNANLTVYVSSTVEYWDYYVTGFIKYPSRTPHLMNEWPGTPMWHLSLCLLVSWLITGLAIMNGVKITGKIMYFTVLFPYLGIILLIALGFTLPGAMKGLKFYLTPNWYKIVDFNVLYVTIGQLFFSSGMARGGLMTYASFNDFRDNFYRDSFIVIIADFSTSVLAGFAIFPILGYMAERSGVKIEKLITSGSSLFFVTFTEALATLPSAQFWTILFMLMAITLGMDCQFALFETVTTGLMDVYPILQLTNVFKAAVVWIMCFFYFLFGLLLVTPGGKYWFLLLDRRVMTFVLPFVLFIETVVIGHLYGFKNLRYDFRMMMGFYLGWYWFVMISFVCPLIVFCILVGGLLKSERVKVYGLLIPFWAEMVGIILIVVVIIPTIAGIFDTIISYRKKYPNLHGKKFLKTLFDPPIYWGPYYKHEWMKSCVYRNKLLRHKNDPQFLKYLSAFEDIHYIAANTNVTVFF